MSLPPDVRDILKQVAIKKGFKNSNIILRITQDEKELALGVIYYVTIGDKKNPNKKLEVFVKKAIMSDIIGRVYFPVRKVYLNECHFYSNIWPSFQKFQRTEIGEIIFNMVPICHDTDTTEELEKIILENLNTKHFRNVEEGDCFYSDHLEYVFAQYGKFHAISMAFRKHNAQLFSEKSQKLYDYYSHISTIKHEGIMIRDVIERSRTFLLENDEADIKLEFEKYIKYAVQILMYNARYRGDNEVITHGDCQTSNLLFRYEYFEGSRGIIDDMKFVDFQSARAGTPVYDLSYSFYAYMGGTEEMYEDLEHYLHVYHDSLSEALRKFNCDPEEIYSYKTLKEEWKEYCRFGFINGLLVLLGSWVRPSQDLTILSRLMANPVAVSDLKSRALTLIRHMFRNGFL